MTTGRAKVAVAVLGALLLLATAYLLGRHTAQRAEWHTVTIKRADVVGGGRQRLLTVNVDGWAYGLENSVDYWVDRWGSTHSGSWPECLEPVAPGDGPERNPGEVTFRFATVEVDSDVVGWRPVLLVDCRT